MRGDSIVETGCGAAAINWVGQLNSSKLEYVECRDRGERTCFPGGGGRVQLFDFTDVFRRVQPTHTEKCRD